MQFESSGPVIEPTPKLRSAGCRLLAWAIVVALKGGPLMAALYFWYSTNLLYGAAAFLVGYLVAGIAASKMRNSAIPLEQLELPYTDLAIATWFLARNGCETTGHRARTQHSSPH